MLEVTPAASAAIAKLIAQAGADVCGLRIAVTAGGCAGLQYRMGLEAETAPGDTVLDIGQCRLLIDEASKPLLSGTKMDFREAALEAGFVFDNPNAVGRCGCGRSACG